LQNVINPFVFLVDNHDQNATAMHKKRTCRSQRRGNKSFNYI